MPRKVAALAMLERSLCIYVTTTTIIITMEERKRRRALTDTDRLMIRKRNQIHPSAPQKDLAEWFTKETGHEINQSMISKILSKNYDYLDGMDKKKDKQIFQGKKNSIRDQPDLEAVLFEWQ